ncbi:MAG TPA: anaerobic glycerol-3-phosphate dehydrogenase subunit GlpB [Thermodesulfobacteriota bacterium]|nr:anaerobic glycerol-3-phosphate dehydrogenase subunit GlpB [Thermodesulfobacteriota bacterium]
MHFDVIIIGMGLSGLMAAKTAVERGKKVLIIGKGMGTLIMLSHTIDLLGTLPQTVRVKEGLPQWIIDHPEHPYGKAGFEKIEEALSSFNAFFPPPYSFQAREERNSLIPTGAGTLRPTYLIPSTMMKGVAIQGKKTLIVGFKRFKDFFAQRMADSFKCRGITLYLPENPQGELTATALARWMEQAFFREAIATEIRRQLKDESMVGFPAVLGLNDPMGARKDLEKRIGVSIFEIPVLPPSIPGLRVFNRFKARLLQKGATFLLGHSVSKAIIRGKRCDGLEVFHSPVTHSYSADRYLLATGRFIGGGLQADRERIIEPLFDLPLDQPPGRQDWFQGTFFGEQSHPVHRSGILVDSSFRPVDTSGNPLLENVWVAGTILAHHHCIDEKSREGIEITTGFVAAQKAFER